MAAAFNTLVLTLIIATQLLIPVVAVISATIVLLPVSLWFTVDLPDAPHKSKFWQWLHEGMAVSAETSTSDLCSGRPVWMSGNGAVLKLTLLLVFLSCLRFCVKSHAEKMAVKVNRANVGGPDAVDQKKFEELIVRHGRFSVATHMIGCVWGTVALMWLFCAAFVAVALGCWMNFVGPTQLVAAIMSIFLLLLVVQSQDAAGTTLPAMLLLLGAFAIYLVGSLHFDAWIIAAGGKCSSPSLQSCRGSAVQAFSHIFLKRKAFFISIALWGLHPLLHNYWSFLLPRWYAWKLSRFLKRDKALISFGQLNKAYSSEDGTIAPYFIMNATVHHIWRLPRWERGSQPLEHLRSAPFQFSPFFVGNDDLGFVSTKEHPHKELRLAAATAMSGAVVSNHIKAAFSQFHHLLTFISGLTFGFWLQYEPHTGRHEILGQALIMTGIGMLHFAGAACLLVAWNECTLEYRIDSANRSLHDEFAHLNHWNCEYRDGDRYVFVGFAFFLFEIAILPTLVTWVRSVWRTDIFGKWFSEWLQIQGFTFPHNARGYSRRDAHSLPRHVYISDGAHLCNLGIWEPLRRRSRLIICAHSGVRHDNLSSQVRDALSTAAQDPSIRAHAVPLEWRDGKFRRRAGNMESLYNAFDKDMNRLAMVVGVEYGPYPSETDPTKETQAARTTVAGGAASPMENVWSLLIFLANRPSSEEQCHIWGVPPPVTSSFNPIDAALADPELNNMLHPGEELERQLSGEEHEADAALEIAFLESAADDGASSSDGSSLSDGGLSRVSEIWEDPVETEEDRQEMIREASMPAREPTSQQTIGTIWPAPLGNSGEGKAVREEMYKRTGFCCPCCHRNPRIGGFFRGLTRFPNHHLLVACFTQQSAEDYQRIGFAVTVACRDMLKYAAKYLEPSYATAQPPWITTRGGQMG